MEIDFFENFKEINIEKLSTQAGGVGIRTSASWDIKKIQRDAERIINAQKDYKQKMHGDLQSATT